MKKLGDANPSEKVPLFEGGRQTRSDVSRQRFPLVHLRLVDDKAEAKEDCIAAEDEKSRKRRAQNEAN